MTGRVQSIHVAPESGQPVVSLHEVDVVADLGLSGDRHAQAGSDGQVTVVSGDALAEAEAELGSPIAPGATRRNVTVAGLDVPAEPGARLRLGPVLLEVTGAADPCQLMEELIGPGALKALVGRAGARARVLEGGRLAVGDPATIEAGEAAG